MQAGDLEAVLEIGRLSFPMPWSAEVFHEEMARGWARLDVLRRPRDGRAVAYSNYWQVADELHLLNVATHPEERRGGCASRLLDHMLELGRRRGFRLVTLEVRRSNEAAQRLYRRFDFKSVGVRPSYYADNQEDAVVMVLELRG
jgi:ribosomal-protein-alanine N-acetyltransferase